MKTSPRIVLSVLISSLSFAVLIHLLLDASSASSGVQFSWHFLLALSMGFVTVGYAWNLRCPSCRAPQVFRGLSVTDIRWPGKRCYRCGVDLDQKYVNGRPGDT